MPATKDGSAVTADTRLYQAVHKAFRLATDRFVETTQRLEPSALLPVLGNRWSFYTQVLHHHHHTEDDSIFPALVALRPELAELIATLEEGHRLLTPRMEAVDDALAAFERKPEVEHKRALHEALVAVRDEFFPHLDLEDAQVLPAIAVSIPPRDWKRMDDKALRTLPRKWLSTAVGALDEVVRGLPEAERPAPPPPPIRMMLALSWRRKYAAWIKPVLA